MDKITPIDPLEVIMFELIVVFFIITTIPTVIRLGRIKRHYKVLYNFCDVRRKMMKYLRDNSETIDKNNYVSLRTSLDLLNK